MNALFAGRLPDPGACDRMRAEKSECKDSDSGDFQRKLRQKRKQCASRDNGNPDFQHQRAAKTVGFLSHINGTNCPCQINDKDEPDDSLRESVRRAHQLKSDIIEQRNKASH